MDEELDKMMADALLEIEGLDNDTDADDNQQEESIDSEDDEREDADNQSDDTENERDDDQEGNELDDEDEEEDQSAEIDEIEETSEETSENNNEKFSDDFERIEVEVNGQKISINNKDEMLAFVRRGASSMGTPRQRKSHNDQIIEQGKLSNEDLTLLIDAKNGNKSAIAKLAKDSGVDIYDLEDGGTYSPEFNPQFMSEADEVAEDMLQDSSFVETFQQVIKSVPAEFTARISSDADALRNFGEHIRSGLAQKIIPEATKQQLLHGGNFMDHYAKIGREMYESNIDAPKTESKAKRVNNPRADKLRKRASNKKGSNKSSGKIANGDDVWNLSDKDFEAKYGS